MSERVNVVFLGRDLGTASGWDGDPGESWWVYDFEPNNDMPLHKCSCLQFNESKGQIIEQDDAGNSLRTFQIEWVIWRCCGTSAELVPRRNITKT